jgi:L-fuculose-phosphate aldolase
MTRPPERRLREQLLQIGRLCYERHLLVALDGNLSARLSEDLLLCTPAGCHKGLLTEDQLLIVDCDGRVVRGRGEPTSEMAMHLACYRARSDVEAVVHAHPPIATACTIAGTSMARCVLPEVVLTLGTVPTLEYDTTGTAALAERVGLAVRAHDAVMLDRHGAVCVGTSLLDAFCKLETLEHMAMVMKAAVELGGIRDLPCDEAAKLRSMGLSRYGGPPEAVARAGEPGADLPPACLTCAGCERAGDVARAASRPSGGRDDGATPMDLAVRTAVRKLLG